MKYLNVGSLSFSYGKKKILDKCSFSLEKGEIAALMAPSGKGKTTLLQLIAGLLIPESGNIEKPADAAVSYAFQDARLFPWLTVEENITAVLRKDPDAKRKAHEVLELTELTGSEKLYPDQLSGGMKQRVGLARALVVDAPLLLLDEPFSGLDDELKARISDRVRKRCQEKETTVLLVTHEVSETERLADRIIRI